MIFMTGFLIFIMVVCTYLICSVMRDLRDELRKMNEKGG